jgi:4-diphosphocytidyl-2-C-methyl-D-erythritol kinase
MPIVSASVRAPAKLNLDLRILGRRSDGYHELRTLFQSIALHDTLKFTRRPGRLIVRSRTPAVPRDDMNLVWVAGRTLWESLGRRGDPHGVAITISKRIPMAAGLGGGSSDAASALRGLCALWDVAPSLARLRDVGASVGADVPYFLTGGLALGTGCGGLIRRLFDLDCYWIVLAIPSFGVPTTSAYGWYDRAGFGPTVRLPRGWRRQFSGLRNDLQFPVVTRHPDIGVMIECLQATGAVHAAMTGSGSSVFALYRRHGDAAAACRSARRSGWHILLSRMLGAAEFGRLTALEARFATRRT